MKDVPATRVLQFDWEHFVNRQHGFLLWSVVFFSSVAAFVLGACFAGQRAADADKDAAQEGSDRGGNGQVGPLIETVLTGLANPRGVVVLPDGSLMVAEAGTGNDAPQEWSGRLTHFQDTNRDGDFSDEGERIVWLDHLPTYNALQVYTSRRDEVGGPGDLLRHTDGHLYLSVDGGHERVGLYEISPYKHMGRSLSARGNMNGITFARDHAQIYLAESTANALSIVTIEDGVHRQITHFGALASGQQSVPAGVAVDPRNGDLLVALFSGMVWLEDGVIPFIPGDSVVVRVDPETGAIEDAVLGLTTAIDVAVDSDGNIYVVEMSSDHADPLDPAHDLFDPDQPPLHGGYLRFSGRVSRYAPDGSDQMVLADGLDMPTNITLAPDGSLYVSTGQGTPNRPIPGPDGPTRIVGEVIQIRLPGADSR